MLLLKSTSEAVVAEAVVVIKRLLQQNPETHKEIIERMSRLATTIAVPAARASILWLLGEYSALVRLAVALGPF
jgi:AP-3 complex subunit beta